jgi:hypothetical protein
MNKETVMRYSAIFLLLLLFGCNQAPVVQQGPDAKKDAQGLTQVQHSAFDKAFADAAVDLKQYKNFQFAPLDLSSIEVVDPEVQNNRRSEWEFTDKDAQQMQEAYMDAVQDVLGDKDNSLLVQAAGPGVALVKSKITHFAPSAPKYNSMDRSPRSNFYTASSGHITIVTEIVDSQTLKPLVNLEDYTEMGDSTQLKQNNHGQYLMDLRNTFFSWARKFRNRWELIHGK